MLQYYVYYYCILIRPSGLLFSFEPALLLSILMSLFCFFILFHSCRSHAQMFGKTLVNEFLISYSHTEWNLLFSEWNYKCTFCFQSENVEILVH